MIWLHFSAVFQVFVKNMNFNEAAMYQSLGRQSSWRKCCCKTTFCEIVFDTVSSPGRPGAEYGAGPVVWTLSTCPSQGNFGKVSEPKFCNFPSLGGVGEAGRAAGERGVTCGGAAVPRTKVATCPAPAAQTLIQHWSPAQQYTKLTKFCRVRS